MPESTDRLIPVSSDLTFGLLHSLPASRSKEMEDMLNSMCKGDAEAISAPEKVRIHPYEIPT